MSDELGRGGRLVGRAAPELVAAGYAAEIGHARRLARAMSRADLAHAVALVEGGAVGGEEARSLISGLLEPLVPLANEEVKPERLLGWRSTAMLLGELVFQKIACAGGKNPPPTKPHPTGCPT